MNSLSKRCRQVSGWAFPKVVSHALGVSCTWFSLSAAAAANDLSDHTTERFSGAANCAFCHDQWSGALIDSRGRDVSITSDWRGTMMAHSFKDPFWRATMEAEVRENPDHKAFIEDKCLTCHAPMARAEAREQGSEKLAYHEARKFPLAQEGVGCTLCHQIEPGNLGAPESFTGQFALGKERLIYGPYEDVVTMPMRRHVDYTPTFGKHTQDSALCGTCHTLFTPVLGADGKVAGQFPEQTPFLEWRHSGFAAEGTHCQDCHLPRLDEPIKISARPPWLDAREPFWRHQFAGGNVFMLRLLLANGRALEANAEPSHFEALIKESRAQLARAAELQATARRESGLVILETQVINRTGHKFPTGHPYRRAWLHVTLKDRRGRVLFESGGFDRQGHIRGLDAAYPPHYDVITRPEEVQVYQAIMGDLQGKPTWSLLRGAALLKDNRLPPRGFDPQAPDRELIAIRGEAAQDPNFHREQGGGDQVTYRISVPERTGPLTAEIELLYQPVPPEAVARLLSADSPEAKVFTRLYRRADKTPERVHGISVDLPAS